MNNILCECDVLDGYKEIYNETVDIIIVDPPYNIGKNFGASVTYQTIQEYTKWFSLILDESFRVLKKSGTIFIYGLPEIIQHIGTLIPIEDQRWLFWHYTNKTVPSLQYWQRSCEIILSTWVDKEKRIFNRDDVREEYTETYLKNAAGKKRKNTHGRFGDKETVYKAHSNGALPRDVIKIPALAGGAGAKERLLYCKTCNELVIKNKEEHAEHDIIEHPTQKPLKLGIKLIQSAMDKHITNIVLIPFCGSGSEVIAARMLGQNIISFDNNSDYIHLTSKKLSYYGLSL